MTPGFENYTYVQLYFIVLTMVFTLLFVYSLLTGTFLDLKQQMHGIPDQMGLLTFQKRMGVLYSVCIVVLLWMLWNITYCYAAGSAPGDHFLHLYQFLFTPKTGASTDATSVLLAILTWLVCRFYRYHIAINVSVYSRRQTYNVIEVVSLYVTAILIHLAMLADAPDFVHQPRLAVLSSWLRVQHVVGVALLLFATKLHGDTHHAFTKLRKNKFGHITTTDYKVPKGGWFDVVTCPHYLAEVLSFVAVGIILGSSSTWWLVTAFVTANQAVLALSTHHFYSLKFDDFPKDRKMLIPFLL